MSIEKTLIAIDNVGTSNGNINFNGGLKIEFLGNMNDEGESIEAYRPYLNVAIEECENIEEIFNIINKKFKFNENCFVKLNTQGHWLGIIIEASYFLNQDNETINFNNTGDGGYYIANGDNIRYREPIKDARNSMGHWYIESRTDDYNVFFYTDKSWWRGSPQFKSIYSIGDLKSSCNKFCKELVEFLDSIEL